MKILLPVDGSALALDAVHHALRLVREGLRASFVLANVQEPTTFYEMMTLHDAEALARMSEGAAADALQGAQALLEAAGVEYEVQVGTGDVAHTLLDIAEEQQCDAIVMSARGVGGLAAALGSVSQTLLHDSRLPLTIVRHVEPEAPAEDVDMDEEPAGG
ncbi:universal stress protein [Azohydromonas caseinilytica]|uniref:Universal stress protein n=1 Tax=Azohydromonas caseinilytica TaxID=2728836 RepID=A0A848F9U1_9BURK|nr:universal stress protein [Azohydromonas caseinilytica]NML14771.1 universal stress protein [Azohydromonas caseinilytica]